MGSTGLFDHKFWHRFVLLAIANLILKASVALALGDDTLIEPLYEGAYTVSVILFICLRGTPQQLVRLHVPYTLAAIFFMCWWLLLDDFKVAGTAVITTIIAFMFGVGRLYFVRQRSQAPRDLRAHTTYGMIDLIALPMPHDSRSWAVFSADRPVPVKDILGIAGHIRVHRQYARLDFIFDIQDGERVLASGKGEQGREYLERMNGRQ